MSAGPALRDLRPDPPDPRTSDDGQERKLELANVLQDAAPVHANLRLPVGLIPPGGESGCTEISELAIEFSMFLERFD